MDLQHLCDASMSVQTEINEECFKHFESVPMYILKYTFPDLNPDVTN